MRFTSAILLAATAITGIEAQEQKPLLSSWLDKAKSYVGSGIPSPSDAGAAAIAKATVTELTPENWKNELRAREGVASPQNWLIQVTGGNKTCHGLCKELDAKFNKTAALLTATPGAPHLGRINCETTPVLCSTFFTGPPVLWYVQIPGPSAKDQTRAPTNIHVKGLNATTTTVQEMVDYHAKKEYLQRPPVESIMHPFDGQLSKLGLNVPVGYALYYLSLVPSWGVMLAVSFITRNFVTRRATQNSRSIHGTIPAAGVEK